MGASEQSRTHPQYGESQQRRGRRSAAIVRGGRGQRQHGKEETDAPLMIGQLVTDERQQQEQQRLLHEGGAVLRGTKYIMRSDIVHERPVPAARVAEKFKKGQLFGEWTRHYEPSCLHYTE